MNDSGYSGKPLVDRLGYKAGETVMLLNAPAWFKQYLDKLAITPSVKPPTTWGHAFFITQAELELFCKQPNFFLKPERSVLSGFGGIEKGIWVSWPKKSSGVETDLTEQMFRDYILPLGWVDTKICAIDETWSGLKFLRRKVK